MRRTLRDFLHSTNDLWACNAEGAPSHVWTPTCAQHTVRHEEQEIGDVVTLIDGCGWLTAVRSVCVFQNKSACKE